MKLYATVTSERATKGQGGNNYLEIAISVGDDDRYKIRVTPEKLDFMERGYSSPLLERRHSDIMKEYEQRKGKRQKGEICPVCHGKNIEGCSYWDIEGN